MINDKKNVLYVKIFCLLITSCSSTTDDILTYESDAMPPSAHVNAPNSFESSVANTSSDQIPKSGSRIEVRTLFQRGTDGSVWRIGTPTLYDTQLNENCDLRKMIDGTIRCVPSSGVFVSNDYFADHECSSLPLVLHRHNECGDESRPKYAHRRVSGCVDKLRVHIVGQKVFAYFVKTTTGCVPSNSLDNFYDLYLVGEELPPSSFVEFTDVEFTY